MDKEAEPQIQPVVPEVPFEPGFAYIEFGLFIPDEILEICKGPDGGFRPLKFQMRIREALKEAFGDDYNAIKSID